MPCAQADPTALPADPSRAAMDFAHRLLCTPAADQRPLDGLLAELAGAFRAPAAGLAGLCGGVPRVRHPSAPEHKPAGKRWPWEEDPELLLRAQQAPAALSVARPEGDSFLLTAVGPLGTGWLVWVEDSRRAPWTDAEAAALALAGQALGRWLNHAGGSTPRWAEQLDRAARQQRLEHAAHVARRLAHDFGNVLTGILGFSELALAQQVPATTPLHGYLTEVLRGAQGGAQYTQQLRLFSRRQAAPPKPCSLAPVLAEEEARLRSAQAAGLSLHVTVPPDLPPLSLDADHLRHLLAALLDNAREALVGPGSITVSARLVHLTDSDCRDLFGDPRPGPHVEVCVADTGTGLSPEAQRRLFTEPFFSTKPRRRGFGLAVAYGILHAHRGGLRLHPGAERGVVARAVVPVAPPETPGQAQAVAGRGERVLVVDDDPMILQFVSGTLERAGYRVQAVPSGEAGLEAYAAAPPDAFHLVLTDVIMPRLGGVDLARRLLARNANVRVLFMSGQAAPDFGQHDFASQQFELLTKPFRAEGLLRAVRQALDRPDPARAALPAGGAEGPVVSSSR
jgi:signal transduction histidine kinase/ActR/RegA family two-component response regulator